MKINNKIFLILLISYSCKKKVESVSNSQTFIRYYTIEANSYVHIKGTFKSFFHYIYIGKYIVKTKSDTLFLLKCSRIITDTTKTSTPIEGIIFVNNIDNFPKSIDDQNADEIRKDIIFDIIFKEDSLKKGKYEIQTYNTWYNGKYIEK